MQLGFCLLAITFAGAMACSAHPGKEPLVTLDAGDDPDTVRDTGADAEGECERLANETASAELGTGTTEFVPISDGDELPITWGPQGGVHVWGGVRVSGLFLGPENEATALSPEVEFIVSADGQILSFETKVHRMFTSRSDGTADMFDEPVRLLSTSEYVGWTATLQVKVTDACGNHAEDERAIKIGAALEAK